MGPVRITTAASALSVAALVVTFAAGCRPLPPSVSPARVSPTPSVPASPPERPPGPSVAAATAVPAVGEADAAEVVRLTNVERAKVGCGSLTVDIRVTVAAQAHSVDMATRNYFGHTGADGSSVTDRLRAAGYVSGLVGENIAAGSTTAAQTMARWMNSDGYRANILNCSYTVIGIGLGIASSPTSTNGTYWTQDFGRS